MCLLHFCLHNSTWLLRLVRNACQPAKSAVPEHSTATCHRMDFSRDSELGRETHEQDVRHKNRTRDTWTGSETREQDVRHLNRTWDTWTKSETREQDVRHVNRTVKEATEIHVNKNNFNKNGVFVLRQARSFNKHVNRRKTGPSRTGRLTKTVCLATSHKSRRYITIRTDIWLSVSPLLTRTKMVLGTSINLAFNKLTQLTGREYFIRVKTSCYFINCSRNNRIKDEAKSWLKEKHLQLSRGPFMKRCARSFLRWSLRRLYSMVNVNSRI
jgi:hypothetical protein